MDPEEVTLSIHQHPLTPLKDRRKGDCCGIEFEGIYDGYYCSQCDIFFHKKCSNFPIQINRLYHDDCWETLYLSPYYAPGDRCKLCKEQIVTGTMVYVCRRFCPPIHMDCAKYPPPKIIQVPKNHDHKLKLEMTQSCFTCFACGKDGDGFSYKCHECDDDLKFHVSCQKYAAEVNHPCHSLHPLKLIDREPPAYTDGKCRLCGQNPLDNDPFYHCSTCNFTLDLNCLLNPPQLYIHDLKTHDHKLTLMPKSISFTCTTCGLNGDRSPYVCLPCDFMAHNDCSGFPWVININRHDHRVSRTSLLGVVEAVCGVCRKKMDWSCGGYSCKRCSDSAFHTKCATRRDVWDGKELKDQPEEDEDIEPFKVIDENTILHFIHEEHPLRLDKSGIYIEERYCKACIYPIYHHSFYSCMDCDFMLHESCANMPRRKRHMVSNKPLQLEQESSARSVCEACKVSYNGFGYFSDGKSLDLRCASVSEPFFHQSHPEHPLFYTSPKGVCSACNQHASHVLRCVEDNCGYILDFKCALLPYEVKNRVDDHFLSLYYGEDASGKYWCDICEKETDPQTWFYTCKDCGVTLHIDCVLGDFRGLESGRQIIRMRRHNGDSWTVRNNSMSRPICNRCNSRCVVPIILKVIEYGIPDRYACSLKCLY